MPIQAYIHDPYNAFCQHTHVDLAGAADGPLAGLTFAIKDVFHVAGHKTGFGSPEWFATHDPAIETATVVRRLLDAGARVIGKTHTDELTYSINGENYHYGTPVNPKAPARIPGGSSSGSAVAVAAGLCDFALGTDSGGSVRTPASFCGVFGMRPSLGRIPMDGIVPHAPSFGTVGWLTRDPALCERLGRFLLEEAGPAPAPGRMLVATDAFAVAGERVTAALRPALDAVASLLGPAQAVTVSAEGLEQWMEALRVLQAWEVWSAYGDWVTRVQPRLGPGIKERFDAAARVTRAEADAARVKRDDVARRMAEVLAGRAVLCLPTTPGIAPLRSTTAAEIDAFRYQAFRLLCIAGLAGLPQINLPLAMLDGCPLGLSLIAARGNELLLLDLATRLARHAGR